MHGKSPKLKMMFLDHARASSRNLKLKVLKKIYKAQTVRDYVARPPKHRLFAPPGEILFQSKAAKIGIDQMHDIENQAQITRVHVTPYDPYLAALKDVRICGGSSIVFGKKGVAINDTLADPDFGDFVDVHDDPTIWSQRHDRLVIRDLKVSRTVDRAFHLSGFLAAQFGHWYAEFLPRLRHFEQLEDFASVPILVNSDMPASHNELLTHFCDNQIIRIKDTECFRVKELLVAPTITFFPPHLTPDHTVPIERQAAWSAEAMHYMRNKILARCAQDVPQTQAVYLSRRKSSWGVVENESEVEECLQGLGFEIVQLERHSFAEQVAILRSSHTIVGATGSALNLLMLANTNTDMVLLAQSENHNWGGWSGPMRDLGFDPQFLLMDNGSKMEKHMPITVDIARLRRILTPILEKQA